MGSERKALLVGQGLLFRRGAEEVLYVPSDAGCFPTLQVTLDQVQARLRALAHPKGISLPELVPFSIKDTTPESGTPLPAHFKEKLWISFNHSRPSLA
jgi:hypothetical protein